MIIGLRLAQEETKVRETISILWRNEWTPDFQDQLMAVNEIFVRGVEMMRQVQEEFSTNVQCKVEESTYRIRKEMIFDDEYEPLEEVEEEV